MRPHHHRVNKQRPGKKSDNQSGVKSSLVTDIFGVLFILPALFIFVAGPLDTIRLHVMTSFWVEVPATLNHIDVKYHSGDSTTYSLEGSYEYRYHGRGYSSDQISYYSGSDNIGSWHSETEQHIRIAAGQGRLTAWVNPDDPQESYLVRDIRWAKLGFMSIFFLIFGGAGGGVVLYGRYSVKQAEHTDGVVYSGQNITQWILAFMAGMFFLLPLPAVVSIPSEMSEGNSAILVVLLFPAVATGLAFAARKSRQNWLYYGRTPLTMNPVPGNTQGDIGGEICIEKTGLGGEWNVRLQCVRSTRSSGKNSHTREAVLWQRQTTPEVSERAGATYVQFVFQPDDNLPASYRKGRTSVFWRLTLTGPEAPVKLERSFVLPVVDGHEKSTLEYSAEHQSSVARDQIARASTVLNEELQLGGNRDNFIIESAAGRHLSMSLLFAFMGVFFSVIGVVLFNFAESEGFMLYLMGAVFVLFGVPFALGGVFSLGRSLEARITPGKVETVRRWMGRALWRRHAVYTSADQLQMSSAGTSTVGSETKEYFHIGILDGHRTVRVGEMIEGREAAELLMERLSALLISDELL